MYKSINTLAEDYEISRRTVERYYRKMRESSGFYEGRDYRKVGRLTRISERAFARLLEGL